MHYKSPYLNQNLAASQIVRKQKNKTSIKVVYDLRIQSDCIMYMQQDRPCPTGITGFLNLPPTWKLTKETSKRYPRSFAQQITSFHPFSRLFDTAIK